MTIVCTTGTVLGAAADGRVRVRCGAEAGEILAAWALPFRFVPEVGDVLQLLGQNGRWWVTGIVAGRGRAMLAFRGDARLGAAGELRLSGAGGVRIAAPEVHLQTESLQRDAGAVVAKVGASEERTAGALEERAGATSRMVDGLDLTTAGRVETVAKGAVRIDGDLLQLG
ncbi:MAG: hypothetical protein JNK49_05115 [Planctomycetes bacterium]|nr:hypothetical protein [Planctomycetota bacterium]